MATTVNRGEFLVLLETAQPGLSGKDVFEQSSCFVFTGGWLATFNGEVACRCKTGLPADFEGAVDAAPLLSALGKMAEETVDLSLTDAELLIEGRSKAVGVRRQAEILLPLESIERPGAWGDLPPDFGQAVEIVQETVGTKKDEFLTLVIHVHPRWMESCDRFQATRYKIRCGNDKPFLVRQASLKHVVRYGMHKMSETDQWVHFKNPAGLIYSIRRFVDEYQDLGSAFAVKGREVVLPKAAEAAADLCSIFSSEDRDDDKVLVDLSPGRMRVTGRGTAGWARQDLEMAYKGEPVQFRISPKLLTTIVQKYAECEISHDLTKLRASGEKWAYVSSLAPVEETKEPAKGKAKGRKPEPEDAPADEYADALGADDPENVF